MAEIFAHVQPGLPGRLAFIALETADFLYFVKKFLGVVARLVDAGKRLPVAKKNRELTGFEFKEHIGDLRLDCGFDQGIQYADIFGAFQRGINADILLGAFQVFEQAFNFFLLGQVGDQLEFLQFSALFQIREIVDRIEGETEHVPAGDLLDLDGHDLLVQAEFLADLQDQSRVHGEIFQVDLLDAFLVEQVELKLVRGDQRHHDQDFPQLLVDDALLVQGRVQLPDGDLAGLDQDLPDLQVHGFMGRIVLGQQFLGAVLQVFLFVIFGSVAKTLQAERTNLGRVWNGCSRRPRPRRIRSCNANT